MVEVIGDKIVWNENQLVSATEASKRFGQLRIAVKDAPRYILDKNSKPDLAVVDFQELQKMAVELHAARVQLQTINALEFIEEYDELFEELAQC